METKFNFNFNSAICTSKVQSERLLALGLKKETADMVLVHNEGFGNYYSRPADYAYAEYPNNIPAWSLHRIWEMLPKPIHIWECGYLMPHIERKNELVYYDYRRNYKIFDKSNNLYDNIIDCIEWLIKEGYFNKEYLV